MKPNNQNPDTPSDDPDVHSLVLMRLLISLMGDEVADYAEADRPPEVLRRSVSEVSTPVLRGVLIDAVTELSRRRGAAPESGG